MKDPEGNYFDPASDEGKDPLCVSVNEVVDKFNLVSTDFKKKEYMTILKQYIKKVIKALGEDKEAVKEFKKEGMAFAKSLSKDFKNYTCLLTPKSVDGMVVLMKFSEDGMTPSLYFWRHGSVGKKY